MKRWVLSVLIFPLGLVAHGPPPAGEQEGRVRSKFLERPVLRVLHPSCPTEDGGPLETLINTLLPSTVMLSHSTVNEGKKVTSVGSGTILNEGLILTNAHVVKGKTNLEVKFSNGNKIQGEVVFQSERQDLAIVRVEKIPDSVHPVTFPKELPKIARGKGVLVIGNPSGESFTVNCGIVSNIEVNKKIEGNPYEFTNLFTTDAAVSGGNSGGPVFDKHTGEMLGIVVGKHGAAENLGYVLPLSYYSDLRDRYLKSISPSLEKAGLQRGFESLKIEGEPVTTRNELFGKLLKYTDKPVLIEFIKDGRVYKIEFTPKSYLIPER